MNGGRVDMVSQREKVRMKKALEQTKVTRLVPVKLPGE